jgi:RecA-family ATPase
MPLLNEGPTIQWTVQSLREWMQSIDDTKQAQWLVTKLIPKAGITLLSGHQKKTKKTWLADMLALCIATGKSYGEFIALSEEEPSRVLYIQEEGQDIQTKLRLIALCRTLDVNWSTELLLDNVSYSFQSFVRVNHQEWRDRIRFHVEEHEPSVVIFDGLSFIHDVDENSKTEMAKVVDALREIRNMGSAVLCLAHLDKSRGDNVDADMDSQLRGSSLMAGAYDTHIALRKYDDNEETPIKVKVRHRGSAQYKSELLWDIETTKEGDPKRASFECFMDGDTGVDDTTQFIKELKPDVAYTLVTMMKLWQVGHTRAMRIKDALLMDGSLQNTRGKYKLKGLRT